MGDLSIDKISKEFKYSVFVSPVDVGSPQRVKILDSSSHTRLSDYGNSVLNCYEEKGFRLIRSEITAPPELEEFLELYHGVLSDLG